MEYIVGYDEETQKRLRGGTRQARREEGRPGKSGGNDGTGAQRKRTQGRVGALGQGKEHSDLLEREVFSAWNEHRIPLTECQIAPWDAVGCRLFTWWDMEQFSAGMIFWSGMTLERLWTDCMFMPPGAPGEIPLDPRITAQPVSAPLREKAIKQLQLVEKEIRKLGLSITSQTIEELVNKITERPDARAVTYQWLMDKIISVRDLLYKEVSGKTFFYVSPERAKFWPMANKPHLFGERVAQSFPSASPDISYAGIALAVKLSTASVFHLMRVLEVGLMALGKEFQVSADHKNWGPIIDEIESKVRAMHQDAAWKTRPDRKDAQEFYAQAISHLGVVKEAWRNYTMHWRGKYTEDEAELMLMNVRAFMQKLAQKLTEQP